jgi:DNA polymerase I-like protein with 3'-5' exonuclease and polymerase domains
MRADAEGLFWIDAHPALQERTKKAAGEGKTRAPHAVQQRAMPALPETGWKPPTAFPRLDSAQMICIDCETYDPDLLTHGPGWGRGVGHIVGIAVGTDDGQRWYFPMRHIVGEGNLPPEAVLQWCRDEFGRAHQPKVFANSQYDLGWLKQEGVDVAGDIIDVQIAEPLLDEHRTTYALDSLAEKYLGEGKVDDALYNWCHRAYGGKEGRPQAGNIYRAPPSLVGPYAEGDVDLPLRIWQHQKPLLEAQGLMELFQIEAVIPRILVGMRMKGVRVDVEAAGRVKESMINCVKDAVDEIKDITGVKVDIWAAQSIAAALDKKGITYPKTAKGAPSFTSEWLEHHPSKITSLIRNARRFDKASATFIDGYILDKQINGRIHGQFHQLRSERGGTIVGRFSSDSPNLENIPSRDEEIGPMIRTLWLPEDGAQWTVYDFSQIQFRIICHYAIGAGADEARAKYHADPQTDYHNMVQALIKETTGVHLERKPVKTINFGLAFTMGLDKLAENLGLPVAEAKPLIEAYHAGAPFIRTTADTIATTGQQRGYIKGILGRRHRFDHWEPRDWNKRKDHKQTTDRAALVAAVGGRDKDVVRAFTHLGLNRLAQDGEGSHVKKALVECYKAGLFNIIGYPLNIVHDDVNFSNPETPEAEEALTEARHIMENAIKWKVPMRVERTNGPTWGEQTDHTEA